MVTASLTADGEELLGRRDGLEAYALRGKTMGIPLLHPWANRLSGWQYGEVELDEHAPGIRDDGEGHPIHGLLHGAAHFHVDASWANYVDAHLDFGAHPEWLRSFPFPHVLEVAIELTPEGLRHRSTLRNTGIVPCPIAFGWHPYFVTPEKLQPVDEPSDLRSYSVGRVTVELEVGYDVAHLFVPPKGDIVAFEPMTAPIDALRTGVGLRHVPPGQAFSAEFRVAVSM